MKNYFRYIAYAVSCFVFLLFLQSCGSNEQEEKGEASVVENNPPFWNDIQNFKKQDSASFPPKNAILFIGSSSFTLWQNVADYFPGYTIINRGFGGSTLLDQIRYVNDIVFPYQPKQIVLYCGENDLASSDSVTAVMVFERYKKLDSLIRSKLDIAIVYISMKPSPSRRHLFSKMREANAMIKEYIEAQIISRDSQPVSRYVDVHSKMLNASGQPMPEIFLEDSLHMNAKGYAIWQKEIQPHLMK